MRNAYIFLTQTLNTIQIFTYFLQRDTIHFLLYASRRCFVKFRTVLLAAIGSCFLGYVVNADAENDTITIAPYGNSITQAAGDRQSYRYPLWKKLIDANIAFDFVGSMNTNFGGNPSRPDYKGKKFDMDHEGHWGWRADEILNKSGDNINNWLTRYTPDMVLLHIGTNDCIQGQNKDGTLDEIKQIIGKLRADNPNVVIFLANLIPCNSASASVNDLNSGIKPLATQLTTTVSPVIFVDQNTGINPQTDLYDGIHPGPTGEEKMAQKWFDAIKTYLAAVRLNRNVNSKGSRYSVTGPVQRFELILPQSSMAGNSPLPTEGYMIDLLGKTIARSMTAGTKSSGVYIFPTSGSGR
jgi:hypothetical protein